MDLIQTRKRIEQVETLTGELKIAREMLKAELENDPSYVEAAEEAKLAAEKKKSLRNAVLAEPSAAGVVADIKEKQEELSTLQEILSAELYEVYEQNKTDQIEGADGAPRKFKVFAKLVSGIGKKRRGSPGSRVEI